MITLAAITIEPVSLILWLLVGAVAGWLAGRVMNGGGFGLVGDIIVGLVGSVIGGVLFGQFSDNSYGLVGSIVVAFIGACLLIALFRFMVRGRSRL